MRLLTTNASDKELYAILGLPETASEEEIRTAFRSACRVHHPDVAGNDEFFRRLKHAHDILVDPQKRTIYNETGMDPDDGENKDRIAALGLIRGIAMVILNDGKVDVNLVGHIQSALQQQLTGHIAQVRKAEQKITKSEKLAANIEKRWRKGAPLAKGAIAGMIASQTEAAKTERAHVQRGVDVATLAVTLMAGADWEMEMPTYQGGADIGNSFFVWNVR